MMDAYEFNKIAGAILGTCLLVLGLQSLAGILYHAELPEKPGFEVAVTEAGEGAAGEAATEEEAAPLATLLASADAGKGEGIAKKCAACHTFEQGGANKIGPNLYEIVGRAKGGHEGFAYSDAIKAKGGEWSFEDLFHFLLNPKEFLPGTKMAFAGIKSPEQRADLLAYLRGLSASPAPLPEAAPAAEQPAAAPAEQPAAAPAEQPAAAPAEQPAAPVMEQPAAPSTEQPAAPATEQPAGEQPASPGTNQ